MRRKYCEVKDPQGIDRILCATTIGRMATNGADGFPYITPVNSDLFQKKTHEERRAIAHYLYERNRTTDRDTVREMGFCAEDW